MFGLQPTDLLGILIVALLLFGPSRLPAIGKAVGSTLREFQNAAKEVTATVQNEAAAEPPKQEPTTVACRNCASFIAPDARFCHVCGAEQEPAVAQEPTA